MLPPPLDRHCERSVPTCLGVGRVALSAGAVGLDDIFVIGDSSGTVMGLKTEDGLGKADIRHFTSGSLDDSVHNPLLFGQWHDGPVSCKNPRVCLTCAPPNPQPAAMILKFSVYGCETFPSVTASHSPSASPSISLLSTLPHLSQLHIHHPLPLLSPGCKVLTLRRGARAVVTCGMDGQLVIASPELWRPMMKVRGLTTWTILQKDGLITSDCVATRYLSIKWP